VTVTEADDLAIANITAGCNVSVTAGGSIDLVGNVTAVDDVSLIATNGTIAGNGTVSGDLLTATAANGSITVNTNVTSFTGSSNGSITVTEDDAITLLTTTASGLGSDVTVTAGGTINVSGNVTANDSVTLTATSGNISGSGLVTGDNVTATASNGSIDLTPVAANTLTALASGDITVSDNDDLVVANATSTGGNVTVTATGNLTATLVDAAQDVNLTGGSIVIGTLNAGDDVTLNATASNLTLGSMTVNGTLTGTANGTLSTTGPISAGNDVVFTGADISIGANVSTGENVSLNATGPGGISGAGLVTGDNVTATALGNDADIVLNLDAATLTAVANCSVTVTEADSLAIANITAGCNVSVTTGGAIDIQGPVTAGNDTVTLNATSGNISGAGLVTAENVFATASNGSIDLTPVAADAITVVASGDINVSDNDDLVVANATSTGGNVTVTALGNLTATIVNAFEDVNLTGASLSLGTITAGDDVTLNATASDLTLGGLTINGTLTGTAAGNLSTSGPISAGQDVVFTGQNITIGDNVTAGENVSLNATTGDINGTAGLVTGDNVTATALGNDADIVLNINANTLTATANCSVTVTEADDLAIANITAGCNVSVIATGNLTVAGSVNATIEAGLYGSSVQLDGPVSAYVAVLQATNGSISGSGLVSANDAIGVAVNGSITLNTSVDRLQAVASGDITVTENNSITLGGLSYPVVSYFGNVTVTAGGAITVGANSSVGAGENVSLDGTGITINGNITASGDVDLNASTTSVLGSGLVSADRVTAEALTAGGVINLNLSANSLVALADSDITFTEADDITLVNVTNTDPTASITGTAGGNLTVDPAGIVSSGEDVLLTAGALNIAGPVTAVRDVRLNATIGDISGSGLVTGDDVRAEALGNDADIVLNLDAATLTEAETLALASLVQTIAALGKAYTSRAA
jgi:filamentous hemagglutinin